jgi:hypothetical protein
VALKPPALAPPSCDHLVKLLGMLGSAHDGERAAAGLKAHQFIIQLGLTWGDFIHAPSLDPPAEPDDDDELPDWREMVAVCAAGAARLRPKERGLIATLLRWQGDPTEKQLDWLARIYERVS